MSKLVCAICGKKFEPKSWNQICCSFSCSQERQRQISRQWIREHPEQHKKNCKKWWKEHSGKMDKQQKVNVIQKGDPKWIKDYVHGDRLTKIAMLARALRDYKMDTEASYGRLSLIWDTDKYDSLEKQVFSRKRKEKHA